MPLLEVRGLQKTYNGRRVVDGVDFHVGHSEIVGLLGPNGAGKTTTFRMLMGMVKAEAGDVKLAGEDISNNPMYKRARKGMGYLSQEPSIFRNLSVEDNILAILETQNVTRSERQQRLTELIADLGLSRVAASKASTLSGGERRRLEIARALVTDPDLMMLDEPFAGVDPKACADIQKIISSLRVRGMSILITDHNVFETFAISDRVYIIHDGKVLKHGSPEDLINDKQAQRLYLGDKFDDMGNAFQRLRTQIAEKSQSSPSPRIGRTTRIIRLEEAEHRRKMSKEYFDQEAKSKANLAKTIPPVSGSKAGPAAAQTPPGATAPKHTPAPSELEGDGIIQKQPQQPDSNSSTSQKQKVVLTRKREDKETPSEPKDK